MNIKEIDIDKKKSKETAFAILFGKY